MALLVSAVTRTAASALLILLTAWAVSIIVVPRVAASAGELLHPTPDAGAFWTQAADALRANRPKRDSDALRLIQQQVISRALGRELTPAEAASANLNRAALGQEISEVLGAQVYAEAYGSLYRTYDRQRAVRRAASVASPAIAMMHWSSALTGTDIAAHRHFALAAEQQRQALIRRINEDMMVNGAGQGYEYLPDSGLWSTVPNSPIARRPRRLHALRARRPARAAGVGCDRHRRGVARRATPGCHIETSMTLRDMFLHEWRTRLAQPAALASIAAFCAILAFAAVSGRVERDARVHAIASHEARATFGRKAPVACRSDCTRNARCAGWRAAVVCLADGLELSSSLPPAPLADFSVGQADLLPGTGKLSLWDPDVRLFSRYEIADPVALALGAFDLSKAIVLLLPLLMIALSFDVLSAERDAGRLGLTLAQGADLRRLFWQRLSIRSGGIIGLALLLAAGALSFNAGPAPLSERFPSFALWVACAALYGLLWLAIIGYITSRIGAANPTSCSSWCGGRR